jgi:hypothetical protein
MYTAVGTSKIPLIWGLAENPIFKEGCALNHLSGFENAFNSADGNFVILEQWSVENHAFVVETFENNMYAIITC